MAYEPKQNSCLDHVYTVLLVLADHFSEEMAKVVKGEHIYVTANDLKERMGDFPGLYDSTYPVLATLSSLGLIGKPVTHHLKGTQTAYRLFKGKMKLIRVQSRPITA